MATVMTMPTLGGMMEEGTITKWYKQVGDSVKEGEPLLEILTDKANMEVESPTSGILRQIVEAVGQKVPVKKPIAIIGSADESIDNLLSGDGAKPAAAAPAAAPVPSTPASVATQVPAKAEGDRIVASPKAKKFAADNGVDIALLAGKGTGPGGRISEADVQTYLDSLKTAAPAPAAAPAPQVETGGGRTIPFTGMRKIIAENMVRSAFTSPHVTLVSEVDMTACVDFRTKILSDMEKTHGVRLSYTAIVAKAAALALKDHPIVNSSLAGDQIVIHDDINVAIAVSLDQGLVVPVVRNVDRKPLHEIAKEIAELADRARTKGLPAADMRGGTFTISNLAPYGIDSFNPVINPPQSAILGVCRTVEKPVIVDGELEVRSMMNLCLSFDHRVMDGAPAAQYLARVRELLETPYLLLV